MELYPYDERKVPEWQTRLIEYYQTEGRKNLPWRLTQDPWKILLAEMLLRKTTAAQAVGVYDLLAEMPPADLADMKAGDLESILKPLGIHKERAVLLIEAAEKTVEAGRDALSNEGFLESIRGAGPYAVSMVLCGAFGEPKPALDRNMIRLLERVFSIKSVRSRPHTDRKLWKTAEDLVPLEDPREYNWGVLDIAAAVCRPRNPKCAECVLLDICEFGQS